MFSYSRNKWLVLLAALLMVSSFASIASAQSSQIYRIVALGDSISAGYEHGMKETAIPYGYVDRLYEQALFRGRAEIRNYGILGLTTPGLTSLLSGAAEGKVMSAATLDQDFAAYKNDQITAYADKIAGSAPEIATALDKASLVVLTIGGNDFGDFIKKALLPANRNNIQKLIDNEFPLLAQKYFADLELMLVQLHQMAPNARIVITDQYLPLWSDHLHYKALLKTVTDFSAQIDEFAGRMQQNDISVEVAHLYERFADKAEQLTYTRQLDNHPNSAGYEQIAEAFTEVIWGDYRQPAPRAADVPISVFINGKALSGKPVIVNNTTFLPIRDVAKAVGANLQWVQKEHKVIFSKNGKEVVIRVGEETMTVNGKVQKLATPAYFVTEGKDTKTYVPLAVISSGLDFQVHYSKPLQAAFINS